VLTALLDGGLEAGAALDVVPAGVLDPLDWCAAPLPLTVEPQPATTRLIAAMQTAAETAR
jgi:hypothetical protein